MNRATTLTLHVELSHMETDRPVSEPGIPPMRRQLTPKWHLNNASNYNSITASSAWFFTEVRHTCNHVSLVSVGSS